MLIAVQLRYLQDQLVHLNIYVFAVLSATVILLIISLVCLSRQPQNQEKMSFKVRENLIEMNFEDNFLFDFVICLIL